MTCPECGAQDVGVVASHGFGGAESVHDLTCGHSATMSQVRAADAARAQTPIQEDNDGEQASGIPEGSAVDSQEGGSVGEGGGSDLGVADAQGQPGGQEGEPQPAQGEVSAPADVPAEAAGVAEPAPEAAPTEPASAEPAAAADVTPEASLLEKVEGEIEHFLHPDQAAS